MLVIKAGSDREAPCVAGRRQDEGELEPGEVRIGGGTGALRLYSGGAALSGAVTINGVALEALIQSLVAQALAAAGAEGGTSGGA